MPSPASNSGTPPEQLAIIRDYYDDAAERLRRIVLNPSGLKESSQSFRQARAAQLIQQVHQIQRSLDDVASKWIGINISAAYKDGLRWGTSQAIEAGMKGEKIELLKNSFSLINREAVAAFAADTYDNLRRANEGMANQSATALRKMAVTGVSVGDVNKILAGGVITGEPVQTSRELRELFERIHGKEMAIIDKNGNPWHTTARDYADIVARTRTREAVVKANHDRFTELGIDIVAIDGRITKTFCTAFVGKFFSISGQSKDYPALSSLPRKGVYGVVPPFHPRCSKGSRPVILELASSKQKEHGRGIEDVDQLLNVSAEEAQQRFKDLQIHQQIAQRFPVNPRPPKKGAA